MPKPTGEITLAPRPVKVGNPDIREAFEEVARKWVVLAEQTEWLDRHHAYSPPATDAEKV